MNHWAWKKDDWPKFSYDETLVKKANIAFAQAIGSLNSKIASTLLPEHNAEETWAKIITTELISSSRIEGVILEQNKTYNSVRHILGLNHEKASSTEYAQQIGKLFTKVYREFNEPLTKQQLNEWNSTVLEGTTNWNIIPGMYRPDEIYVGGGVAGKEEIVYQAPPASELDKQMPQFIDWFNGKDTSLNKEASPLARAAITHHWFVMLHPYEDGNGRLGRALMVKSLSQDMNCPVPISLSKSIKDNVNDYYQAIEDCNKSNDLTPFLQFTADVCLDATKSMSMSIDAIQQKASFFHNHGDDINQRQRKILNRLFMAEPKGFEGGLSAKNYNQIVGHTPKSTITRDLSNLVDKGILVKTGELRGTRYHLNMPYKELYMPKNKEIGKEKGSNNIER